MRNLIRNLYLNKLFYIFIITSLSLAQIDYGISNVLKNGEGEELRYGAHYQYNYFENLLDLNLSYSRFNLFQQWEYSDPPTLGYSQQKLHKYYLEYIDDKITIKLGDIYTLYGRGLGINLFQDQSLDFDNSIRGIEFSFQPNDKFRLFGLKGSGQYEYKSDAASEDRYNDKFINNSVTVIGAEFWIPWIYSNLSFLNIDHDMEFSLTDDVKEGRNANINNIGLSGSWGPVDYYIENSKLDWTADGNVDESHNRGNYFYSSLSAHLFGFGITHEFKKYEAEDFLLSISNPPIVFRESASTLLSRTIHLINFKDEIGHQLEIIKRIGENYDLLFNWSTAHRNKGYSNRNIMKEDPPFPFAVPDTTIVVENEHISLFEMNQFDLESVPFFPYNQLSVELEGYLLEDRLYFKLGSSLKKEILTNSNIEYDYSLIEPESDIDQTLLYQNGYEYQKVLTLPNQFSYNFGDGSSLSSYLEFQWISNEFNRDKVYSDEVDKSLSFTNEIYNRYLTLSFRHPKKWTFGAIYDYISFDPSNPLGFNIDSKNDNFIESALRNLGVDLKNKWFGIEIVKDFNLHHQLTVFYGSESGGIRCANGVCSYQAPFVDGLKLTLRSIF